MNQTNTAGNEGEKQKIKDMDQAGTDEVSFDSNFTKPADDQDDKEVDLDRSGKNFQRGQQNFRQQEQQQAGIPTLSSQDGDAVARRAGMNSGTQGIGTGSAQGYEGNTDDSGLPPADDDMNLASTDDERDLSGAGGEDIDDVGDGSVYH